MVRVNVNGRTRHRIIAHGLRKVGRTAAFEFGPRERDTFRKWRADDEGYPGAKLCKVCI